MTQIDDIQEGLEAVSQQEEEVAAAEKERRDAELSEEPLRETASRIRSRQTVSFDDISCLSNIRPDMPEIHELALSIKERGLLQSIQLRVTEDAKKPFELFAGRRRFEAMKLLGWTEVECDVFEDLPEEEAFELMLLENVQRVDLEPIQAARGLRLLMTKHEHDTAADLARSIGLSADWVRRHLKLLDLPDGVRERIENGEISVRLADLLGRAERAGRIDEEEAEEIATEVAEGRSTIAAAAKRMNPPTQEQIDALAPFDGGNYGADYTHNDKLDDGWDEETISSSSSAEQLVASSEETAETVNEGASRERPAVWAQLDAYLLARVIDEMANNKIKKSLGVTGDSLAWANALPIPARATKLRDLASYLAQEDTNAPDELLEALEQE